MLTAAQCASYDESKKLWMKLTGAGEDFTTHLGASMITGVVTTTATGPVDVIKTNMFVGTPCAPLAPVPGKLRSQSCGGVLLRPTATCSALTMALWSLSRCNLVQQGTATALHGSYFACWSSSLLSHP